MILPIRYHREQPISENPDNFTLQRGFRVYKVEGFFTGDWITSNVAATTLVPVVCRRETSDNLAAAIFDARKLRRHC
ncbi:MAG: hypothetical protein VXZ27_03710, partial [SAR324 cluster bacterium]|nr:hypothetical protein [SAR324 cluster bacterium]